MVELSEYLVHKVDKLWKEIEDLRKRVEFLENKIGVLLRNRDVFQEKAVETGLKVSTPISPPPTGTEKSIDPVIKILKEKGPMNIIQLNSALKEIGIAETVRDTLFKRVKKLMEEEKVGFDDKTQTFYLR